MFNLKTFLPRPNVKFPSSFVGFEVTLQNVERTVVSLYNRCFALSLRDFFPQLFSFKLYLLC